MKHNHASVIFLDLDILMPYRVKKMSYNGSKKEVKREGEFQWIPEMFNSLVLAGLAFCSTMTVTGDVIIGFQVSSINAGVAFFTRLAIARGILGSKS